MGQIVFLITKNIIALKCEIIGVIKMKYNEMKQAVNLLAEEWKFRKKRIRSGRKYLCMDIFN